MRVRKVGNAVILEPLEKLEWPRGFWERLDALPPISDDFVAPKRERADTRREAAVIAAG